MLKRDPQTTYDLPEKLLKRGWQITHIGQSSDATWYAAAFYNPGTPFASDPTHQEGFEVRGCPTKLDAIEQIAELIKKKIEDFGRIGA